MYRDRLECAEKVYLTFLLNTPNGRLGKSKIKGLVEFWLSQTPTGVTKLLSESKIKFFREITYGNIEKNKTTKYLKYAFEEIVLVMIGLLLAFKVNNCNGNRIDLQKELVFLFNL